MRAAVYRVAGEPFSVESVARPTPRPNDVVVKVEACSMVPNLPVMLDPPSPCVAPPRPTIYGCDAVGIVSEVGSQVRGFSVGDRVYVNPHRFCGNCRSCRRGNRAACDFSALSGYFGIGPRSYETLGDYPVGGYAEWMTAPAESLVRIPATVSPETATRWGYLGTGYAALQRAGVDSRSTVLINGISGTLGLGTALFALALGVSKILGVGRDAALLAEVKALAPDVIEVHSNESQQSVEGWARDLTEGAGADVVIDALPTGGSTDAYAAAVAALGRGGTHVNIGGVIEEVPINVNKIMHCEQTFTGSFWMTTLQGEEMADLVDLGRIDLDVFAHEVFALDDINHALEVVAGGKTRGGFSNYVVRP